MLKFQSVCDARSPELSWLTVSASAVEDLGHAQDLAFCPSSSQAGTTLASAHIARAP